MEPTSDTAGQTNREWTEKMMQEHRLTIVIAPTCGVRLSTILISWSTWGVQVILFTICSTANKRVNIKYVEFHRTWKSFTISFTITFFPILLLPLAFKPIFFSPSGMDTRFFSSCCPWSSSSALLWVDSDESVWELLSAETSLLSVKQYQAPVHDQLIEFHLLLHQIQLLIELQSLDLPIFY